MGKQIYVLVENSIWDYEQEFCEDNTMVYDNFEKAYKEFINRKNQAMEDMLNFIDENEMAVEENIDKEKESAEISIYEDGDYTKTHCDIYVIKKEVL